MKRRSTAILLLPGAGSLRIVFRALDADTRSPVPGARLSAFLEAERVLDLVFLAETERAVEARLSPR